MVSFIAFLNSVSAFLWGAGHACAFGGYRPVSDNTS